MRNGQVATDTQTIKLLPAQSLLAQQPRFSGTSLTGMCTLCRAMGDIKNLNSTAVYAWTTLISVFICVPAALIMEV